MAHLAFIAPPFLGHLNPMASLARELVGRGHRATFIHMPDAEPMVAARGLAFRPVGAGSHPLGTLPGILRRMALPNGPFGLPAVIRDVAAATDMLCRELPSALRAIGADLLVCDQTEAAGGLVAAHLAMPYVSVASALPLNREPGVPPPFTGWRYDPSRWGTERNLGGYRVSDLIMRRHAAVIADHAEAWSLAGRRRMEDCVSPFAEISQLVPGLDMPRSELPATFHYCGPLRGAETIAPGFRLPPPDRRPLAFASLGTLQGSRAGLFRRIADAAHRANLQLVLAHGGGLGAGEVARLPGRPAAFALVPQGEVLNGARVAILNGGLNTVLDAMSAGVPTVVVPVAFEQGAIAARVERAGAGRTVSRYLRGAGRIARAIREVLDDPSLTQGAARIRAAIACAGGVAQAADIVEAVARTGRPVSRDMMVGAQSASGRAA